MFRAPYTVCPTEFAGLLILGSCVHGRDIMLAALQPLGTLGNGIYGGDAIYMWCRLPEGIDLIYKLFALPLCVSRYRCEAGLSHVLSSQSDAIRVASPP